MPDSDSVIATTDTISEKPVAPAEAVSVEVVDPPEFILGDEKLIADFNGDKLPDTIRQASQGAYRGYLVNWNGKFPSDTLGVMRKYGDLFDDFSWVDRWKLVPPGDVEEVTFIAESGVDSFRTIYLDYPGIELTNDDLGGGILTWKKGTGWFWVHQTD